MYSIKKSFADCSKCNLLNCKSVIADSNCKHNLSLTDILIVGENPTTEDISNGKPIYDTIFKNILNTHMGDLNYFISNVVLCQTLNDDGSQSSPTQKDIDICKTNIFKMVEICNPKLILTLGKTASEVFGFTGSVQNSLGKLIKYKNWDVMVNMHPSDVQKQGGEESTAFNRFESVFIKASDFITGIPSSTTTEGIVGERYMYQIDPKFYTNEYRLVDIQYIATKQKLIFIFRDKDNKKIFWEPIQKDLNYYWYESLSGSNHIEKIDDLQLKVGPYKDRCLDGNAYESDIKPDRKHAVDYYLQSKGECPIVKQNVFYLDIEVYTFDHKGFPDIEKAEWPINAISFAFEDEPTEMYLLNIKNHTDPNLDTIKKDFPKLTVFNDERQLLTTFIKKIHEKQPDYLAGWNLVGFDMQYIYSRLNTLGISPRLLSPYGNVFIDGKRGVCDITGYIVLDQFWLYKNLTYTNEPSYKLEYICQKVLGVGKRKYEGTLNDIYEKDIRTFIEYSFIDTDRLPQLEDALGHISLQNELRTASTTTFSGASSTTGLADGLFNYELKKDGYAMINAKHNSKEGIIGAYVRDPVGGIYDWVIDFDYTSLYPSIICSYNIGPNTYIAKVAQDTAHDYIYNKDSLSDKTFDIVLYPTKNTEVKQCNKTGLDKVMNAYNCIMSPSGCIYKGHDKEKSIFYNIIKKLFKQRKTYKHQMFVYKQAGDKLNMKIFNNKQMAYKILLNSLYGVMAQEHFRFYNLDLASTVTITGRDLIMFAGQHCDAWMTNQSTTINTNYKTDIEKSKTYLRYCDTDSLFLWMKPYLESKNLKCNIENIKAESKKIQTWLNTDLLKSYAIAHNINPEESMFELKNEMICKRYYALNVKKRYALHVINNEGVDVDEIDVKGLEIKRSDFSDLTKEMLNNILDMILRTEEVDIIKILKYIDDVKDKARDMAVNGDPKLYKAVSFSKPIAEYKALPQHIKGMLMWNSLEFEHFQWGSKGILFPLKAFDLYKAPQHVQDNYTKIFSKTFNMGDLNVIVIPEEYEKLPPYYIPDINKIIEFAVTDRSDLLLEPLVKRTDELLLWDM